mgnify:FL=1
MNRKMTAQKIGKGIQIRAGMGQEEIQKLADSDLTLNVRLTNDFAFKKVFRNKKALAGLLSALLEIPVETIVKLEFLDTLQLGNYPKDKKGILDIKVHLNNSKKINIELQVAEEPYWKERSLFYLCRMYTADLASGENYSLLEPCIHISILAFDPPEGAGLYSTIRIMDEKTRQIYSDKLGLRVLYLKKLNRATRKERKSEVYHWAKLISARDWDALRRIAMQDEYKAEAVREMEKINADRYLRYEYISQEIAQLDENTRRAEERRLREVAHEAGRLEGLEAGRLEGLEAGRAEERQIQQKHQLEKTKIIAQKMLENGTSVQQIADILEFPEDEITLWFRSKEE